MKKDDKEFKLLIVDDVPKNIQVAANILQNEGYLMAFAQNGKTALSQAQTTKFDLILLDIMMPEMDGFEVCRLMKEDPSTRDIPIIFLTAKSDTESIVKGFDLGATDYVTKPFNGTELSARVKTHLELNHAREKLKEANATKDKFFSIIAHDLKNPFHALIGLSKHLLDRYDRLDDSKKRDFIKIIHDSSDQAYRLLENLLDWSRIQTDRMDWEPMGIGLHAIAHEIVSLHKNIADKKNIAVSSEVAENTTAFADPNMTTAVIRNLVSNAVKFTGDGGEVRIASKTMEDYEEITVSDTGIGISTEDIEKLFRIDVHHTTNGTAKERGTGLGLILCGEFIEKNGGRLWVESELGRGSEFKFILPRKNG